MTDILVVDDDPVYGALILERLEATRWSAEFFQGPFGAVNVIRQLRPKLVILDVNMPALSGAGIADLVRRARDLADVKLMFHSSVDPSELHQLATQYGADAALSKSVRLAEFLKGVEHAMALRPVRRPVRP